MTTQDIPDELRQVRNRLDELNYLLLQLLVQRSEVVSEVARIKKQYKLEPLQPERYRAMVDELLKHAQELGLDEQLVSDIFDAIHKSSLRQQDKQIR